MYTPEHFSETSLDALHEIMRAYPLATLVSQSSSGSNANHLPLHLTTKNHTFGILSGHIARANPLWQELSDGNEVLVIFHGPHAYVTPSWYPAKAKTGMVLPTWNYVVVHARGKPQLIEDTEWLRAHLHILTADHEARFDTPWQLEDAPSDFIEKMMRAVVGIEIEITQLAGKWKLSQNQSAENQIGVLEGLRKSSIKKDLEMASVIERKYRL